jgi:DNA polymerase III delta prime subunit
MLIKKYAPQSLSEMVFANETTKTKINAIAKSKISSNFVLLYGPNGTGKSTAARLIINSLTNGQPDFEEKPIVDLLKITKLDWYFKTRCHTAKNLFATRYVLKCEEFDNVKGDLSKLWTALDEVQEDIVFIATTNEPLDIHKSLRSRLYKIEVGPIGPMHFLPRAMQILTSEGFNIDSSIVLDALKTRAHECDIRAYFQILEELILLENAAKQIEEV